MKHLARDSRGHHIFRKAAIGSAVRGAHFEFLRQIAVSLARLQGRQTRELGGAQATSYVVPHFGGACAHAPLIQMRPIRCIPAGKDPAQSR